MSEFMIFLVKMTEKDSKTAKFHVATSKAICSQNRPPGWDQNWPLEGGLGWVFRSLEVVLEVPEVKMDALLLFCLKAPN